MSGFGGGNLAARIVLPGLIGETEMNSPTPTARGKVMLRFVLAAAVVVVLSPPAVVEAQLVQGVQQGAQAGNKAAGPVGGVLGGAIGGVVGVFTGVLGVGQSEQPAPAASKQAGSAKAAKAPKAGKATKQAVLTQPGEPQLTAE